MQICRDCNLTGFSHKELLPSSTSSSSPSSLKVRVRGLKDNSGCYSEEVVEAGSRLNITQIKSVASIKSRQAAAILTLS